MSKISTYPSADTPLLLSDRLIGTEAIRTPPTSTPLATKNFSLSELLQLFSANFPAASLQAVLNTGNTATQNITLTGTIDVTLIKPNNIEDSLGSQGTTFQYLSKNTTGINWVNLPVDNLQDVLNAGNTATQNITLIGNITSTKIIPGNIQDDTASIGTTGQILQKTASGIRWVNNSIVYTPGLNDVLLVGNTATNSITLIGDINASNARITGAIYDSNNSPGTAGQVLSSTVTGTDWIDSASPTAAALTRVDDTNVTLTLGGTPATSLLQAVSLTLGWTGTLADSRIASASNWNTAYTNRITSLTTTGSGAATLVANVLNIPTPASSPFASLTTTGSSGSSTLIAGVLNVPTYTLSGLGGQPLATNLTSLSGLTYASTSFVKMTAAGTFSLDTNTYLTGITSGQVTTALGYTPVTNARTLTINGTTYDLTADRSWTISASGKSINVVSVNTNAGSDSSTDYVYLASGTINITLPTAVGNQNLYTIKNVSTGVITINTTSSQTIDGSLTAPIKVQYLSLTIISDGANWNII